MVKRKLIVGGVEKNITDFSFTVRLYSSLQSNTLGFCGGSLIRNLFVLTAAHCVYNQNPNFIQVGTMRQHIDYNVRENECSDVIQVANVFISEYYNGNFTDGHDVAILELSRLPKCIGQPNGPNPIKLLDNSMWRYSLTNPLRGPLVSYGMVSGWGRTQNADYSENIMAVTLRLYSSFECQTRLTSVNPPVFLHETNGCVGSEVDGFDACNGDSGGPLFVSHENEFYQIGLVSWGPSPCGVRAFPGIYFILAKETGFFKSHLANFSFESFTPVYGDGSECDCITESMGCFSGAYNLSHVCGCAFHDNSEDSFCYVKDPNACTTARSSLQYLHTRFKSCTIPEKPFYWQNEDVSVPTIVLIMFTLSMLTLVCAIGIGFRKCGGKKNRG